MNEIPAGMRNCVLIDAAFSYAYAREDLNSAQNYFQKFKPYPFIPNCQVFATEATISVLKNEYDEVLLKIIESFKNISKMMDKGLSIALIEKLNVLRNKIESIR